MKRQVVILYNRPVNLDEPSETDVVNEVDDVEAALRERGWNPSRQGLDGGNLREVMADLAARRDQLVVFNLTEGLDGEARHEPLVSGLLELFGIRYTGNPPMAMAWSLDKAVAKAVLLGSGVPAPVSWTFRQIPDLAAVESLPYPMALKPAREDGSLGITADSFVDGPAKLRARVADLLERFRQPILAEPYLPGREFNVSVLGEGVDAYAMPVAEMQFLGYREDEPRIVTHQAKWESGSLDDRRTVPKCPADLAPEVALQIQGFAVAGFVAMECRDYARLDFRMDADGHPQVIDVNPNPDISRSAGLARAVAVSGLSYEDFIHRLAESAWNR